MKLAFYIAKGELFNMLVRWWDSSPCSHCEVVLEQAPDGQWYCGSSSYRDGGVRVKKIDLDSGHWDVIDIGGTDADLRAAAQWFADHLGQGYDDLGLLGFLYRRIHGWQNRWLCSESVIAALGIIDPWRFSPATIYVLALRMRELARLRAGA